MTDSKPSKSEKKRAQTALQELGEQLLDLPDELRNSLQLDERLNSALSAAKRMKSHEALRRQKQFIGRLMRDVDAAPIQALLDRLKADDRRHKRVFATAERWRDRLLADGHQALDAFTTETGREDETLAGLLSDYQRATSDRVETTVRRNIFRRVHETLAACNRDR